ncbi:hypothetical protein [Pseudomonas syringae]|uniref:hypothetical protein n=2 Tax=Pseudomonas syringae TaxID=317 RepID=UPI000D771FE5|nr:hypothetical protein [Pseudomonas syringae]MCH5510751.1 hypothetical protein [Pseudomonas syringae pv. syringae]MCH5639684.1 hypothetical protein [Pseudomonas syringae pv. syringae]MCH7428641.1 hypothetical protein [Pseudomonas syringae pv. syringae]MDF5892556.1 hypothetical protein [Pseudomonas syringae pv. syringae]
MGGKGTSEKKANNAKFRYGRWVLGALLVCPIAFWYLASPVVAVNFSHEGKEEFRYIWNTQHRIYKGDMPKGGGSAVEFSYVFPDKDFFMMFDWWTDKAFQRCIDITPEWGSTIDIYLDDIGRIDTAKTAPHVIARLKQCVGRPAPFRP